MPKEDIGKKIIESISEQISKDKAIANFCLGNYPIHAALEISARLDVLIKKLKKHENELILYNDVQRHHDTGLDIDSYGGHGSDYYKQFCAVISSPFYKIDKENYKLIIVTSRIVASSLEYNNDWKKTRLNHEFDISSDELGGILSRQEKDTKEDRILKDLFKQSRVYIGNREVRAELSKKKYEGLVGILGL